MAYAESASALYEQSSSSSEVVVDGHTSSTANNNALYIPPSFDTIDNRRKMSLKLGGGNCQWQPPTYDVPESIDFHKTIIAGFPSGDKRMIFTQMEALTGWPAKDEWDFEFLGMSNHPFIKANYPHHEGIWGWDTAADQVVMMIRNIRKSMIEYHDILYDLAVVYHFDIDDIDSIHRGKFPPHTNPFHLPIENYVAAREAAANNLANLYSEAPPLEDWLGWRDLRVLEEIQWYGWFIDYWMEGGLMRDIYTHQITTPEHWEMLVKYTFKYTRDELDYNTVVGNQTVTPNYDPNCEGSKVTDGCEPVAVISAEKLRDYTEGPPETAKIANVLLNDDRTGQYVIAPEAWDCIWEELIENGKGLKTVSDKPGYNSEDYNFGAEMLEEMIAELTRLIDKYSRPEWSSKATANRVVELLTEHRTLIQDELAHVELGLRKLSDNDLLGPKERARRRKLKEKDDKSDNTVSDIDNNAKRKDDKEDKDYSKYFLEMDAKIWKARQNDMKHRALESAREERIKQRAARIVRKAIREARESTTVVPKKMSSESKEPKKEVSATKKMME